MDLFPLIVLIITITFFWILYYGIYEIIQKKKYSKIVKLNKIKSNKLKYSFIRPRKFNIYLVLGLLNAIAFLQIFITLDASNKQNKMERFVLIGLIYFFIGLSGLSRILVKRSVSNE